MTSRDHMSIGTSRRVVFATCAFLSCAALGGCDRVSEVRSPSADSGPDTDTDTDADTDTDTDTDADTDTDTPPWGCDEMGWERLNPAFLLGVNAIAAIDSDEIFAFGAKGLRARYQSGAWTVDTDFDGGVSPDSYRDAWSFGSDDVWATGDSRVFHFDGAGWEVEEPACGELQGIWGDSPDDIYTAGSSGVCRYDGDSFSRVDGGPDESYAIWGLGSDDFYAVGHEGVFWHTAAGFSPTPGIEVDDYSDVSGTGPDEVFVAEEWRGGIWRYDGTTWNRDFPASRLGPAMGMTSLPSLWASPGAGAFVAGGCGDYGGCVFRHTESGWEPLERPPGYIDVVSGAADGTLFLAAGADVLRRKADASGYEHLNGITAASLNAIERSAPEELVAVGDFGAILRGWGDEWALEEAPVPPEPLPIPDYDAIAQTPDGTTYIGGTGPTLLRHTGDAWQSVDFGTVFVRDLWMTETGTSYAVIVDSLLNPYAGACHAQDRFGALGGRLATLDGDGFVALEDQPPCGALAVSGDEEGALYAACGEDGVWRFDGSDWADTVFPADSSANELFAAAGAPLYASSASGELLRLSTAGWESIGAFASVIDGHASADGKLFIIAGGDSDDGAEHVQMFDSASETWQELGTFYAWFNPYAACRIWASGADDVYVTGYSYDTDFLSSLETSGLVTHFDGAAWSQSLIAGSGIGPITGSGPDDVTVFVEPGGARRFDGTSWSEEPGDIQGPVTSAVSREDGTAVASSFWGAVARRDAAIWTQLRTAPRCREITGLWAAADDDIYASCDGGAILRGDGSAFGEVFMMSTETISDVWGSGPDDVYAAGEAGAIAHFDGASWTESELPGMGETYSNMRIQDLWGTAADDVYVAGFCAPYLSSNTQAMLGHWNGTAWSIQAFPEAVDSRSVRGASPGHVYAMMNSYLGYTLYRRQGDEWLIAGAPEDVQRATEILPISDEELYGVGSSGCIMHGACPSTPLPPR